MARRGEAGRGRAKAGQARLGLSELIGAWLSEAEPARASPVETRSGAVSAGATGRTLPKHRVEWKPYASSVRGDHWQLVLEASGAVVGTWLVAGGLYYATRLGEGHVTTTDRERSVKFVLTGRVKE